MTSPHLILTMSRCRVTIYTRAAQPPSRILVLLPRHLISTRAYTCMAHLPSGITVSPPSHHPCMRQVSHHRITTYTHTMCLPLGTHVSSPSHHSCTRQMSHHCITTYTRATCLPLGTHVSPPSHHPCTRQMSHHHITTYTRATYLPLGTTVSLPCNHPCAQQTTPSHHYITTSGTTVSPLCHHLCVRHMIMSCCRVAMCILVRKLFLPLILVHVNCLAVCWDDN
jgi:hypothetical protein